MSILWCLYLNECFFSCWVLGGAVTILLFVSRNSDSFLDSFLSVASLLFAPLHPPQGGIQNFLHISLLNFRSLAFFPGGRWSAKCCFSSSFHCCSHCSEQIHRFIYPETGGTAGVHKWRSSLSTLAMYLTHLGHFWKKRKKTTLPSFLHGPIKSEFKSEVRHCYFLLYFPQWFLCAALVQMDYASCWWGFPQQLRGSLVLKTQGGQNHPGC